MPDSYTPNLNLTKPEVGASRDTWGTKTNGDWDIVDAIFAAAGNGTSVGLNVGSGRTLSIAGTLTASGTVTLPAAATAGGATIVTVSGTQTLTNKTLTTPTISGGTLNDAIIGGSTPAAATFTTLTATGDVNFSGTGAVQVPSGTTGQRPTGTTGDFRFNSSLGKFEGYNGTIWGAVGGGATGGGSDEIFVENGQTVTTNYTITTNKNAMSAGPISVNSGVVVTVPSGSTWTVV